MIARVGNVKISFAVVGHSFWKIEERSKSFAVLIALLRAASNIFPPVEPSPVPVIVPGLSKPFGSEIVYVPLPLAEYGPLYVYVPARRPESCIVNPPPVS